jgi:uncharacterized protein
MSRNDDDESLWPLLLHATHLEALGKYDEAEQIWREAATQGSAEGSFRLGLAAERRNDIVEAQARYEIASELNHDTAMFALGMLNEEMGNRKAAEHWYRLAAEHAHPAAVIKLAHLLEENGDVAEALLFYKRAAEEFSDIEAINKCRDNNI